MSAHGEICVHLPSSLGHEVICFLVCQSDDAREMTMSGLYEQALNTPPSQRALRGACALGRMDVVQKQIDGGVQIVDKATAEAAKNGHFDIVDFLLQLQPTINRGPILRRACEGMH